MKRSFLLFLIIFFAIGAIYSMLHDHKVDQPQRVPSPSSLVPPSPSSPTPGILSHHCIDPSEFNTITGLNFSLTRENQVPEVDMVECEYDATNQVQGIAPSLHYQYQIESEQSEWKAKRDAVAQKASVRYIANKDYLIADLNPVVELAQVTFYGYKNQAFVQLMYTPVNGTSGDVLDKGEKLIEKIFEKG